MLGTLDSEKDILRTIDKMCVWMLDNTIDFLRCDNDVVVS